ncbi:MAG: hypothetical protein R3E97_00075 [Candidatus Eisenbacteria bacterium]
MLDRAFRWRLAVMASGLVIAIVALSVGMFSPKKAIIIDYGILGEDAVGAEVFIDDELAGRLEALTAATRTGFEVEEGAHVVRIEHPYYGCEPVRVETQASRSSIYLRMDIAEFYDKATGESEARIVFDW